MMQTWTQQTVQWRQCVVRRKCRSDDSTLLPSGGCYGTVVSSHTPWSWSLIRERQHSSRVWTPGCWGCINMQRRDSLQQMYGVCSGVCIGLLLSAHREVNSLFFSNGCEDRTLDWRQFTLCTENTNHLLHTGRVIIHRVHCNSVPRSQDGLHLIV